jgi:hypothetical protein
MSIKFNCPHCQKSLKVSTEVAGKRAKCPGCGQIVRIPQIDNPPADVEALAASTLTEAPAQPAAPAAPAKTIKFNCPQCDEPVELDAELAGKQAPCPECRRIIKVPVPVKVEPRDWRTVSPRGPAAGLRKDDQPAAPEGAWGTAVSKSVVSRLALEEAEAVPVVRVGLTVGQWITRGLLVALGAGLAVFASLAFVHHRAERQQLFALEKGRDWAPPDGQSRLAPLSAAEAYRAMGEYYLGMNPPDLEQARIAFQNARAQLAADTSVSTEHDARVIDLALSQIELGGDKEEVDKKQRIAWDRLAKELRLTLGQLRSAKARPTAVRELSRKLIAKGRDGLAATVAAMSSDKERPEMRALVGFELLRAGQTEAARAQADLAVKPYEDMPSKEANPARPPVTPSVVALLVALDQQTRAAKALTPPPEAGEDLYRETRLGYALGWAAQGKWDEALKLAEADGAVGERVEALMVLATTLTDKDPERARQLIDKIFRLLDEQGRKKTDLPWLMLPLIRRDVEDGLTERYRPMAAMIIDPDLQARAQMAILRAQLARQPTAGPNDLAELDKVVKEEKTPACGREGLLELRARHIANRGNGAALMQAIEALDPEAFRPFGFLGAALGDQERGAK